VANVIVIPMTGCSPRLRRRNYFTGSLIVHRRVVLLRHATSLWELVIFRFIQAPAGGAMLSTSQAILVEPFHRGAGMANGLFGLGVVVGPNRWPDARRLDHRQLLLRWIFYVNLPIGILAALMAMASSGSETFAGSKKVDWAGIGLLVAGIGSLQIVLEPGKVRTGSPPTTSCAHRRRRAQPRAFICGAHDRLSHRGSAVLKDRSLAVGTFFTFIMGLGLYASVFIFPVFAQNLLGFTACRRA